MNNEFYTSPERKCRFSIDYVTPGAQGLAWAILLKAVEDGCSKEWLVAIVQYYGIDFDEKLFERLPMNKIKMMNKNHEMIGIQFSAPKEKECLLSMHDGLHIRGLLDLA
jgi:hypothetical protein